MKNIKAFIIFLSLFSLAACDFNDYFSPIVEVKLPNEKPRLVLFCRAAVGDSGITVAVTKTRGILDSSPYFEVKDSTPYKRWNDTTTYWYYNISQFDTVKNATVEIFKNDVLLTTLKEREKGLFTINLNTPLSSEATYRIKVSAAGYETIEAVQKAPSAIKIDSVILRENIKVNDPNAPLEFATVDEYGIKFKDPIGEDNSYYANIYHYYKTANNERLTPLYIFSYDVLSQNNYYNDNGFNGKEILWRQHSRDLLKYHRSSPTGSPDKEIITVELYNFTKDRFLFSQSIERYYDAKDNPFAEPVTIYSNVKNGLGLFTMVAVSEYNLTLK